MANFMVVLNFPIAEAQDNINMSIPYTTASTLYDYTQCPHRVWRDIYGPQEEKIKEVNPFIKLLWERGIKYEKKVIQEIGQFTDLSLGSQKERIKKTSEALRNKSPLIYQGVITHENLLGIPDLLKRMPDSTYIPIEIKSGMGREGVDEETGEGKLKKHYAIQLCLYVEVLQRLGFENKNIGWILDIKGEKVEYNLNEPMGVRNKMTFWEYYEQSKNNVGLLLKNKAENKPAIAGVCKLCPWYDSCKKWCKDNKDLTGIFYLGRSKRDIINEDLCINRTDQLSVCDIEEAVNQKKNDKEFLKGVGEKILNKLIRRAQILEDTKKPVIYQEINFPKVSYELFFDIEDDPTQEFVYMHGVYIRNGNQEKFIDFTAKEFSRRAEKEAWKRFWEYIKSLPKNDFSIYYYSPHEKSTYKKLQKMYPEVISEQELEEFFNRSQTIDLYNDVVLKHTDWPLSSYSIKDIATYLGFKWRDETPSGALSIQWFNKYLENNEPKILKRILEYNEDDCKATMVLKDNIEQIQKSK